ncbi:hypothetical protein FDP41_002243 [Naegleria fowleri]|uniref:Uncharacterized protein n=1 Tax=Naegleria fowleri TaxID=5763 RepID=A0A6A5BKA2_NAEFO|nr:uncharacterized protein FDP41_002243 [Naegleria fowleri]KAF0978423.1 hypothetical protein FDP41_002243 [Naegleria fowleri]
MIPHSSVNRNSSTFSISTTTQNFPFSHPQQQSHGPPFQKQKPFDLTTTTRSTVNTTNTINTTTASTTVNYLSDWMPQKKPNSITTFSSSSSSGSVCQPTEVSSSTTTWSLVSPRMSSRSPHDSTNTPTVSSDMATTMGGEGSEFIHTNHMMMMTRPNINTSVTTTTTIPTTSSQNINHHHQVLPDLYNSSINGMSDGHQMFVSNFGSTPPINTSTTNEPSSSVSSIPMHPLNILDSHSVDELVKNILNHLPMTTLLKAQQCGWVSPMLSSCQNSNLNSTTSTHPVCGNMNVHSFAPSQNNHHHETDTPLACHPLMAMMHSVMNQTFQFSNINSNSPQQSTNDEVHSLPTYLNDIRHHLPSQPSLVPSFEFKSSTATTTCPFFINDHNERCKDFSFGHNTLTNDDIETCIVGDESFNRLVHAIGGSEVCNFTHSLFQCSSQSQQHFQRENESVWTSNVVDHNKEHQQGYLSPRQSCENPTASSSSVQALVTTDSCHHSKTLSTATSDHPIASFDRSPFPNQIPSVCNHNHLIPQITVSQSSPSTPEPKLILKSSPPCKIEKPSRRRRSNASHSTATSSGSSSSSSSEQRPLLSSSPKSASKKQKKLVFKISSTHQEQHALDQKLVNISEETLRAIVMRSKSPKTEQRKRGRPKKSEPLNSQTAVLKLTFYDNCYEDLNVLYRDVDEECEEELAEREQAKK